MASGSCLLMKSECPAPGCDVLAQQLHGHCLVCLGLPLCLGKLVGKDHVVIGCCAALGQGWHKLRNPQ